MLPLPADHLVDLTQVMLRATRNGIHSISELWHGSRWCTTCVYKRPSKCVCVSVYMKHLKRKIELWGFTCKKKASHKITYSSPIQRIDFFLTLAWLEPNWERRAISNSSWASFVIKFPNFWRVSPNMSRHSHFISLPFPCHKRAQEKFSKNRSVA